MIHVHNLNYTYPKATEPAVKSVSFDVKPGEIFGFLGPSGAGKSTTQNILIGLIKAYQGTIEVFGKDLQSWNQTLYERVGVAFEFPNHYLKLTALENLNYFRGLYSGHREDPQQVLDWVGLQDDADKRVSQFSKGMRGRLNLARALLNQPELLFLDEPTSGLDPITSRRIQQLIREKRDQGTTVFLTTHNMVVAEELCDQVAFLVDGQIKLIDAPRTLKLKYGKRTVRVEYGSQNELHTQEFNLTGLADNTEFLNTLRHESLQTIHTQETSLEDIFIQITGRALS